MAVVKSEYSDLPIKYFFHEGKLIVSSLEWFFGKDVFPEIVS